MPDHWTLRTETFHFGSLPLLMGVVNVTPDSFSDGGRYFEPAAAIAHGLRLAVEGADILDVGGESTRPGAAPVDVQEELRRVIPVIAGLCRKAAIPVSVDTSKAVVAREAIAAGAQVINDVTALRGDPEMLEVVVQSGAGVCVMHMQGTPRTMQSSPTYASVVREVIAFLRGRRDVLTAAGVSWDRIALDPGIGFGKTVQHNLALLSNAWQLHELGCPVLVGPSRKSFIRKVLRVEQANLTAGTIGVALALARQRVHVLRVHDVAPARQALILFEESGGLERRDEGTKGRRDEGVTG
jgi:dihydropteroate synthase